MNQFSPNPWASGIVRLAGALLFLAIVLPIATAATTAALPITVMILVLVSGYRFLAGRRRDGGW